MKSSKAVLFVFLVSLQTVFADLPFSSEWNFMGEEVNGAVKTIRTTDPTQTLVDQYNENRQLTSRQFLSSRGALEYERICKYSLFGSLMSVSQFRPRGDKPELVETATYSLPDQIASLKQSKPDGSEDDVEKIAEFEYEEGQLKAIWMQKPVEGSFFSWEFSYDPDGRLQSWKRLRGRVCVEATVRKMNAQGDPEYIESYAENGKKIGEIKYEYRYDENENWTQRVQFVTQYMGEKAVEQAPSTTRRKIEYYDEQSELEPVRPSRRTSRSWVF